MASNSASVYQFRALRWLDEFFGSDDPAERARRYESVLSRLQGGRVDLAGEPTTAGVERMAEGNSGAPDPMRHFAEHWLSQDYWPALSGDVVTATLTSGYRDAIEEARKLDLPLNSIWVCANDDPKSTDFRVDHVAGPNAVTVAIITPKPNR